MLPILREPPTLNGGKEAHMKIQFNKDFGSVWNGVEGLCKISDSFKQAVGWKSKEMVLPINIEQLQCSLKENIYPCDDTTPIYTEKMDGDYITIQYSTHSGKNVYWFEYDRHSDHCEVTWETETNNFSSLFSVQHANNISRTTEWEIECEDKPVIKPTFFSKEEQEHITSACSIINNKTNIDNNTKLFFVYDYRHRQTFILQTIGSDEPDDSLPFFAIEIDCENTSVGIEMICDILTEMLNTGVIIEKGGNK